MYNFEKSGDLMKPQRVLEAFRETSKSSDVFNLDITDINIHCGMLKIGQT